MHRRQLIFTHRFPSSLMLRDNFSLSPLGSSVTSINRCKTCRSLLWHKKGVLMRSLIKLVLFYFFSSLARVSPCRCPSRLCSPTPSASVSGCVFKGDPPRIHIMHELMMPRREIYEFPFDWSVERSWRRRNETKKECWDLAVRQLCHKQGNA